MSLEPRLIEGVVDLDDQTDVITALRAENRALRTTVNELQTDLTAARREASQAVRGAQSLRRTLTPLYKALQSIFGELDDVAGTVDDSPAGGSPTATDPRIAAIWASWKTRLPGQCGKIIDALLVQPDMNTTQLAIAIGTHRQNIPNLIFKLNQAGLINKNGGRFSLKAL